MPEKNGPAAGKTFDGKSVKNDHTRAPAEEERGGDIGKVKSPQSQPGAPKSGMPTFNTVEHCEGVKEFGELP